MIFNFNHISKSLTKEQVFELKNYYATYHRKCQGYKKALKHFKKIKLAGHSLSIVFASGGIVSAAATTGISLVAISTVALLIQGWMKHQNIDLKIESCRYAYQTYQHLLDTLKDILRSGEFVAENLYMKMHHTDEFIVDNSPVIDKYLKQYDKLFTYKQ